MPVMYRNTCLRYESNMNSRGRISQSVESLIADPVVLSSIPARPHTKVEIDHEIISMVSLLLLLIQEELVSITSKIMCTEYW